MSQFKVYDKVWVMRNNRPKELQVFAVVESMDYSKQDTEYHYHLVEGTLGAGWGNNEGRRFSPDVMYATRKELLASL